MANYPWGDDSFPLPVFFLACLAGGGLIGALVVTVVPSGVPGIESGASLEAMRLCVLATLAWLGVYYNALGSQLTLKELFKNRNGPAFDLSTRIVYNQLEQAFGFFALMWLHGLYVDAPQAGALGLLYATLRMLYQFAYSYFGHFTVALEFCTQPCYGILYLYSFSLLAKTLTGTTLVSMLGFALIPFLSLYTFAAMMAFWGLPSGLITGHARNFVTQVVHRCHHPEALVSHRPARTSHLHRTWTGTLSTARSRPRPRSEPRSPRATVSRDWVGRGLSKLKCLGLLSLDAVLPVR